MQSLNMCKCIFLNKSYRQLNIRYNRIWQIFECFILNMKDCNGNEINWSRFKLRFNDSNKLFRTSYLAVLSDLKIKYLVNEAPSDSWYVLDVFIVNIHAPVVNFSVEGRIFYLSELGTVTFYINFQIKNVENKTMKNKIKTYLINVLFYLLKGKNGTIIRLNKNGASCCPKHWLPELKSVWQ